MPGGVGGAAPRGVPLSRSSAHLRPTYLVIEGPLPHRHRPDGSGVGIWGFPGKSGTRRYRSGATFFPPRNSKGGSNRPRQYGCRFRGTISQVVCGCPMLAVANSSPELEAYFRTNLERGTNGRLDTPIVFYCRADCWMSWNATKRAASWGYTHVFWYRDGTDGWAAANLPLAPAEPVSLSGYR